jgi:hypothetical protein
MDCTGMQDAGNATEVLHHDVFQYQIPSVGEDDEALIGMFAGTLEDEILRSIPQVCSKLLHGMHSCEY